VADVTTAAERGRLLGTSTKSCSYHLGVLARQGLVARAEEPTADGRERPWRRVADEISTPPGPGTGADQQARADAMQVTAHRDFRLFTAFLEREPDEPAQWRAAITVHTRAAVMSADQLTEWGLAVEAVSREHVQRARQAPKAGARPVRLTIRGFPQQLPASAPGPGAGWIAVTAAGLSTPPLTAALRATIAVGLTERDRVAAFSLDAIATELLFIAGPALVSAASALGGTADALFVPAAGTRHSRAGKAAAGLLAPWLAIGSAQMAAIAFVEVAATARVIHFGDPAAAGTVLAVWAAGSMAGGLIYGGRDWPGPPTRQLRVLLLVLAAGFAIVSAAGNLAVLYPLMFVAGLACAPAGAALTTSFSAYANRTESFAWLASASSFGGSAGYAVAGLLVAHGSVTFFAGAALSVVAAAIVPRTRPLTILRQ
jgi:hypothetical protein